MASTSELVAKLREKAEKLRGTGGREHNFAKFEEGDNVFRLIEPTSGPLVMFYKRHRGKSPNGNFSAATSLSWLLSEEDTLDAMIEREVIGERDIELMSEYGDPYDILFRELNAIGKAEAFSNAGIGQKRSQMIILMEGDTKFSILDMSVTFGLNILSTIEENPIVTDWEEGIPLKVEATGQKLKRRYGNPVMKLSDQGPVTFNGDPVDPEEVTTPDLYDVMASNCLNYPQKVQFLKRSHRPLMEEAGLDVMDFGISPEDMAESFQYGANVEDDEEE